MSQSYAQLEVHVARGSTILIIFLIIAIAPLSGCGSGGDARADAATAASQNFMTAYYQQPLWSFAPVPQKQRSDGGR